MWENTINDLLERIKWIISSKKIHFFNDFLNENSRTLEIALKDERIWAPTLKVNDVHPVLAGFIHVYLDESKSIPKQVVFFMECCWRQVLKSKIEGIRAVIPESNMSNYLAELALPIEAFSRMYLPYDVAKSATRTTEEILGDIIRFEDHLNRLFFHSRLSDLLGKQYSHHISWRSCSIDYQKTDFSKTEVSEFKRILLEMSKPILICIRVNQSEKISHTCFISTDLALKINETSKQKELLLYMEVLLLALFSEDQDAMNSVVKSHGSEDLKPYNGRVNKVIKSWIQGVSTDDLGLKIVSNKDNEAGATYGPTEILPFTILEIISNP